MSKAPEEGKIWEWRAFGRITDELAAKIKAYPIRLGISNLPVRDIYLISPISDQNVKLRWYFTGLYLKFKLLIDTKPGQIELYSESVQYTFPFPISFETLNEAARLLRVTLPDTAIAPAAFSEDETMRALAAASPPVVRVDVKKLRSQYQFDGGWIEMADTVCGKYSVQTISIHSENLEVVERMIESLQPGDELEVMNYVEACRRWG
ncbi:MAG TPA: hypothetical protein VJX74_18905 [Blastocatellia bacterium]|nr:hypothetical protein [Blastocatellia bacterium]